MLYNYLLISHHNKREKRERERGRERGGRRVVCGCWVLDRVVLDHCCASLDRSIRVIPLPSFPSRGFPPPIRVACSRFLVKPTLAGEI